MDFIFEREGNSVLCYGHYFCTVPEKGQYGRKDRKIAQKQDYFLAAVFTANNVSTIREFI